MTQETSNNPHSDLIIKAIKSRKTADGWSNVLTGMGRLEKDARMAETVSWNKMSEVDLENLYAGDAMASKINDIVPDEATEKGYKFIGITDSERDRLDERLKELNYDEAILEAAKDARHYGGSAILKVYEDDLVLDKKVNTLAPPKIRNLINFTRFDLYATWEDVEKDMLSPRFDKPYRYTYIGRQSAENSMVVIHYSRLVIFDGAKLPKQLYRSNGYWHDSVLAKIYQALRNYVHAHDGVNAAVKDLSIATYKIKNLADSIASNCDTQILKRFEIVNLTKSLVRGIVLDAEGEDFDYKTRQLTGAGDLVDRAEDRLSAESNIPKTVLFGDSPTGGLGQTGQHQENNWHKYLNSYQNNVLKPRMLEIAKEVCVELNINSANLDIDFTPLKQLSEKEEVEMRKAQSELDARYIQEGVLDPSEVRQSRFGGAKYSLETEIDSSLDNVLANPEPEAKPTPEI